MKAILQILLLVLLCAPGVAQAPRAAAGNADLERVLDGMDRAAANFRTGQADFVWEQYEKVINETDVQKGTIYFRRRGNEIQMAADIREPEKKYVLFTDGKVRLYQPRIEQVTEYNAGKNKQEFESFLVLGFGAKGHDLLRSFDVSYAGSEVVDGKPAAKLLLVPKSQRVRGMFDKIYLWIDPARGVSVRQQFIEPSGNYRLAKYTNIQLNQPLADNVFKLQTTSKTKVVRPQG